VLRGGEEAMNMVNKNLITIDDLSNSEIETVFSLADEMGPKGNGHLDLCKGKIMATLFFEPSTRTRMSFEAAMQRLGGSIISAVDINSTSLSKGESIADMARVVGSYADIIVIRHPWEGAAKVVADYAGVPVINAGDGSHEHPTQTLCDLYTLKKEKGSIKGLKVALFGDLKYGRTVHSLTCALARFGATILFRCSTGLEMPEHVLRRLITEYKGTLKRHDELNHVLEKRLLPVDAIYITPESPHQLAMMPDLSIQIELEKGVDALYVTRLQKERMTVAADQQDLKNDYMAVDKKMLKEKEFKKTLVMHPLPRVDELAHELDTDPRSMYFKQAALGVPVRMALIALLLGAKRFDLQPGDKSPAAEINYPLYKHEVGIKCHNPKCVTVHERYPIEPEFRIISQQPLTLRCVYCEQEKFPQYIASTDWHEGTIESKRYHHANSHWLKKIKTENLLIFD
jgi:aspartate carbamoyltransferase catalytic subunit